MNDNEKVFSFVETIVSTKLLPSLKGKGDSIFISPLSGSAKAISVRELSRRFNSIFVVLPDTKTADEFYVELSLLGLENPLFLLNEFRSELIQEKLTSITKADGPILISTYQLLSYALPPKAKLLSNLIEIETGSGINYDEVVGYLNLFHYQLDKFVEAPGEYSRRGSIIDFWSYSEQNPVRLEFDGDSIESIRYFEPESQRSVQKVERVTISGAESFSEDLSASIFEYLTNPLVLASAYELMNAPLLKQHILNFPKDDSGHSKTPETNHDAVVQDDEFFGLNRINETFEDKNQTINPNELIAHSNATWLIEDTLGAERIDLGFSDPHSINGNFEILLNVLKEYSDKDFNIIITSENDFQTTRLRDLLSEFNGELAYLLDEGKIKLITLQIKSGFLHREGKMIVLTDYQIFNKPYRSRISPGHKKKSASKIFASIHRGDFVVHEDFGIGRYAGLETIKIGDVNQESMKILYNDGGVVYVNLNYLSLVKKYSSSDNITPSLSTLGKADWSNIKTRTKKKIKEAARELIELYAKRKASKGFAFSMDTVWQKELEASFIYEDTPDQARVADETKADMEAANPMDRLICGDVGFGKTEVAVRASFKAVQDGKQVAILVPTTILAEQHFNTFRDRLSQFPIRVAALSRFQTKKEQSIILRELEEGQIDIVIGTHRLLSKDVNFKDIGLLIIDEEHRFGVTAKEKLRALKVNVDTLTLTATPIPRTLNLSLLGARDLSIIGTPPPNRQPIYTSVSTFDIIKIREWALNEMRRNGQVYFVHDRVSSIVKLAAYLNKHIPEAKIGIAHGQMKPSQLEDVIHGFLNRKFDILLSTKIIESGIDIPNVNTIIVNRADRFGLAELHQLRGRVGRSARQAYAYFIVPSLSAITRKALRRLQAIEEFTEIGAGFNLSMRDLEIRGAGNLLGTEQTGFINDVGFDLYVKMINESVEELKYQEFKEIFKALPKQRERTEASVDTYFEIGIPQNYMPGQSDRLEFYTSLYSINSAEQLSEITDELIDRFGPLPELVKHLVAAAALKLEASFAMFERVIIQRKNIFLHLPKGEKEDYYRNVFPDLMKLIFEKYPDNIKFNQQKETMRLIIVNNFESIDMLFEFLMNFCREVSAHVDEKENVLV